LLGAMGLFRCKSLLNVCEVLLLVAKGIVFVIKRPIKIVIIALSIW